MNDRNEKVSIVVPIYNRENFLDKCIKSIIEQTYKNIEILLVDDGSKDNSLDVCYKYEKLDNRIRVIHKQNGGVQSARNRGIDEAEGYYLCFVDADDYVSDKFVENFINVFDKEDVECVVCGHYRVNGNYEITSENESMYNLDIPQYESERWALYFERFACYAWNHMFKTDIVKKYNVRYDKDIIIFDDTAFTMNYLNHIHKIGFTNSNDYYYVCSHDDLTVAKRLKNKRVNDGGCREKVKTCILKYNDYIKDNDIDDKSIGDLKWVSSSLYYVAMVSFILYMATIDIDYRYDDITKDKMFIDFYLFVKENKVGQWYHNVNKLHSKMFSIFYVNPIMILFNKFHMNIFRLSCKFIGSEFMHELTGLIRRKRGLW